MYCDSLPLLKLRVEIMSKLIKKLEDYRLENKISQTKLAEILGVTFVTVNRWFNGKYTPNKIQKYHIKKLLKDEGNE